jgi:mRNA interferase RelE/StbE
MGRSVNYSPEALKYLRRMPANQAVLLNMKINELAAGRAQGKNVTVLAGTDTCRLRVGDYRVVFYSTDDTVEIVRIGPRGSVYQ